VEPTASHTRGHPDIVPSSAINHCISFVTCFLDRSLLENSNFAACVYRAVGQRRTVKISKSRKRRWRSSCGGLRRYGGGSDLPQGRDQWGDLLQLAQELRRLDALGDQAAVPARGGERQIKEDHGRSVAPQGDAAYSLKNTRGCRLARIGE